MGLLIKNYNYNYHTLQELRRFALKVEKNPLTLEQVYEKLNELEPKDWHKVTMFSEFINHSDCDGGYVSLNNLGLKIEDEKKFRNHNIIGDLDLLKVEMKWLNGYADLMTSELRQAFEDFKEDVEQEGYFLEFK